MKRYMLAIAALAAASAANAQQAWSLDSCISYAAGHNLTVKLGEASRLQAEQAVVDAKSRYLPSLSAGASQSWNLGRGLTAQNTYADRNTSSFSWNASFSLPLFSGLSTERQVAYAKASLLQVAEQYEAAKEDITVNVIAAYMQALYAKEMVEVAARQVSLSEYELERQQALLEAGKIPEVNMLDAKAQLASDRLAAAQAANDEVMARVDLAQLLELDGDISAFDIAPIADKAQLIADPEETYALALQYSHSISAARRGVDASRRSLSLARAGYFPTLSFNAGLGSSFYKVSGYPNECFGAQMRHNYSTYFGLSLNIPIFDAFSTRNSVRRAKIEISNSQLRLDQAEQQLYRAIQQAYYQALGAQAKAEAALSAEQAAQAAFEAMQEKYNIGRATPTEYEQAKTKALRSTAERIQADYEYILRSRLLAYYSTPH